MRMIKREEERVVYQGRLFTLREIVRREYDGRERVYEYAERPDTIAVLVTQHSGVILLHEEQPGGVQREASLVYGKVEPGENAEEAAMREVREELGMQGRLDWLFTLQPCGKSIRWRIHQYIMRHAVACCEPSREPGERIRAVSVSYEDFFQLLHAKRLDWESLQLILFLAEETYSRERLMMFLREGDEEIHHFIQERFTCSSSTPL